MECRPQCAACCIAASITAAIPGMPGGKPAGVRCVNLEQETLRCRIWGTPEYPKACRSFTPEPEFCGSSRDEALQILTLVEISTKPR